MAQFYANNAFTIIENAARQVIAAVAEGDMLRTHLAILRRLGRYEPVNGVFLSRSIARAAIIRGGIPSNI